MQNAENAPKPVPVEAMDPVAEVDSESDFDSESYWERLNQLYEKARESGEKVPDWVKQDIKSFGTWQYRVVMLKEAEAEQLESNLNELGAERWEVFWMEKQRSSWRLFCKRRNRSYLRSIPLGDLWQLLPQAQP